jgi:hypothetical protein
VLLAAQNKQDLIIDPPFGPSWIDINLYIENVFADINISSVIIMIILEGVLKTVLRLLASRFLLPPDERLKNIEMVS